LLKPGHRAGAPAIRLILKALPIPPAPARRPERTWRQFLHVHAIAMLAADFFHGDCAVTLRRLSCLVVTVAGSRSAHILGSPHTRTGPGPTPQIRTLLIESEVTDPMLISRRTTPCGQSWPTMPVLQPTAATPQPRIPPAPA